MKFDWLHALCCTFFQKAEQDIRLPKQICICCSRTKNMRFNSVGPAILIYCCSALNCRESCQLANTKQERAEAVTKMASTIRERFDFMSFLLFFTVMSHQWAGKDMLCPLPECAGGLQPGRKDVCSAVKQCFIFASSLV